MRVSSFVASSFHILLYVQRIFDSVSLYTHTVEVYVPNRVRWELFFFKFRISNSPAMENDLLHSNRISVEVWNRFSKFTPLFRVRFDYVWLNRNTFPLGVGLEKWNITLINSGNGEFWKLFQPTLRMESTIR